MKNRKREIQLQHTRYQSGNLEDQRNSDSGKNSPKSKVEIIETAFNPNSPDKSATSDKLSSSRKNAKNNITSNSNNYYSNINNYVNNYQTSNNNANSYINTNNERYSKYNKNSRAKNKVINNNYNEKTSIFGKVSNDFNKELPKENSKYPDENDNENEDPGEIFSSGTFRRSTKKNYSLAVDSKFKINLSNANNNALNINKDKEKAVETFKNAINNVNSLNSNYNNENNLLNNPKLVLKSSGSSDQVDSVRQNSNNNQNNNKPQKSNFLDLIMEEKSSLLKDASMYQNNTNNTSKDASPNIPDISKKSNYMKIRSNNNDMKLKQQQVTRKMLRKPSTKQTFAISSKDKDNQSTNTYTTSKDKYNFASSNYMQMQNNHNDSTTTLNTLNTQKLRINTKNQKSNRTNMYTNTPLNKNSRANMSSLNKVLSRVNKNQPSSNKNLNKLSTNRDDVLINNDNPIFSNPINSQLNNILNENEQEGFINIKPRTNFSELTLKPVNRDTYEANNIKEIDKEKSISDYKEIKKRFREIFLYISKFSILEKTYTASFHKICSLMNSVSITNIISSIDLELIMKKLNPESNNLNFDEFNKLILLVANIVYKKTLNNNPNNNYINSNDNDKKDFDYEHVFNIQLNKIQILNRLYNNYFIDWVSIKKNEFNENITIESLVKKYLSKYDHKEEISVHSFWEYSESILEMVNIWENQVKDKDGKNIKNKETNNDITNNNLETSDCSGTKSKFFENKSKSKDKSVNSTKIKKSPKKQNIPIKNSKNTEKQKKESFIEKHNSIKNYILTTTSTVVNKTINYPKNNNVKIYGNPVPNNKHLLSINDYYKYYYLLKINSIRIKMKGKNNKENDNDSFNKSQNSLNKIIKKSKKSFKHLDTNNPNKNKNALNNFNNIKVFDNNTEGFFEYIEENLFKLYYVYIKKNNHEIQENKQLYQLNEQKAKFVDLEKNIDIIQENIIELLKDFDLLNKHVRKETAIQIYNMIIDKYLSYLRIELKKQRKKGASSEEKNKRKLETRLKKNSKSRSKKETKDINLYMTSNFGNINEINKKNKVNFKNSNKEDLDSNNSSKSSDSKGNNKLNSQNILNYSNQSNSDYDSDENAERKNKKSIMNKQNSLMRKLHNSVLLDSFTFTQFKILIIVIAEFVYYRKNNFASGANISTLDKLILLMNVMEKSKGKVKLYQKINTTVSEEFSLLIPMKKRKDYNKKIQIIENEQYLENNFKDVNSKLKRGGKKKTRKEFNEREKDLKELESEYINTFGNIINQTNPNNNTIRRHNNNLSSNTFQNINYNSNNRNKSTISIKNSIENINNNSDFITWNFNYVRDFFYDKGILHCINQELELIRRVFLLFIDKAEKNKLTETMSFSSFISFVNSLPSCIDRENKVKQYVDNLANDKIKEKKSNLNTNYSKNSINKSILKSRPQSRKSSNNRILKDEDTNIINHSTLNNQYIKSDISKMSINNSNNIFSNTTGNKSNNPLEYSKTKSSVPHTSLYQTRSRSLRKYYTNKSFNKFANNNIVDNSSYFNKPYSKGKSSQKSQLTLNKNNSSLVINNNTNTNNSIASNNDTDLIVNLSTISTFVYQYKQNNYYSLNILYIKLAKLNDLKSNNNNDNQYSLKPYTTYKTNINRSKENNKKELLKNNDNNKVLTIDQFIIALIMLADQMYPKNTISESISDFFELELKELLHSKGKENSSVLVLLDSMIENKTVKRILDIIDSLIYVLYSYYSIKDVSKEKNLTISFHNIKNFLMDFEIYPQLINFNQLKELFYVIYEKLSKKTYFLI